MGGFQLAFTGAPAPSRLAIHQVDEGQKVDGFNAALLHQLPVEIFWLRLVVWRPLWK